MTRLFDTINCPGVHNHQGTSAFASSTSCQHHHSCPYKAVHFRLWFNIKNFL